MKLISDARTCKDGCKYLRGKCSALRGRMQCTAEAVAVHCRRGCSALRLRWVKLEPKWSVVFWIREKGDNGIMTKR